MNATENKGVNISETTCHKYINVEFKLFSVTRRHKPGYHKGTPHKVLENLLKQNITATMPDKIMSRAGCPYDNAQMERYFNTLKSELIYQHSYASKDKLFVDIDDYVMLLI